MARQLHAALSMDVGTDQDHHRLAPGQSSDSDLLVQLRGAAQPLSDLSASIPQVPQDYNDLVLLPYELTLL